MRAAFGRGGAAIREQSSVLLRLSARAGSSAHVVRLRDGESDDDAGREPSREVDASTPRPHRYYLVGEIARGGIGVVQQCRDADLGRDVAMKLLREDHLGDPAVLNRFIEEAQIGGQLEHPGIVPVYDLGLEDDRRPYFTMKLIKGRTLAALLSERKDAAADRQRLLTIFLQVCQTVAYAHSRGVIHRDLKPANVMVGAFGEVQVVDWGLAKLLAHARDEAVGGASTRPASATPTTISSVRSKVGAAADSESGSVMGTPAYMPPEQALGDVEGLDECADVFALGAILCELLTGLPPYPGEKEAALRDAARAAIGPALERLAQVGAEPELVELCRDCLAVPRAARPRDASVVAERIGAFLARVEERAHAAQLDAAEARGRVSEERRARRLTVTLAATVVGVLVLGGGTTWWIASERRARIARTDAQLQVALNETSLRLGRAQSSKDVEDWNSVVASAAQVDALLAAGDSSVAVQHEARAAAATARSQADVALQQIGTDADRRRLLAHLEELGILKEEHSQLRNWREMDAGYVESFKARGLDVDGMTASAVAEEAQLLGLTEALRFVIDDWPMVRANLGNPMGAAHLSDVAAAIDPDEFRMRMRQAIRHQDVATLKAIAVSEDLEKLPKPTLLLLARDLGGHRAFGEAMLVMHVAQHLHPDDFDILNELGNLCWRPGVGRPEEAVRYLTAALALRPKSVWLRHSLGIVLQYHLKNPQEAVTTFRDALQLSPDDLDLVVHIAQVLNDLGDHDQAKTYYERAANASPDNERNYLNHARALEALGEWDESRTSCDDAVAAFPDSAQLHFHYAIALDCTGDADRAIEEYRAAVRLDSSFADAYRNLGSILIFKKQDLEGALVILREGVLRMPEAAILHDALGVALHMKGELAEALVQLRLAVQQQRDSSEFHRHLAETLHALKDAKAARAEFEEAIRLAPDDLTARLNYANLLMDLRENEPAILQWKEALRIDSKCLAAHYNLGNCLRAKGDFDRAADEYRKAIAIDSHDADSHRELGVVLSQTGALAEGIRECGRALESDPVDSAASENLCFMLWQIGDLAGATRIVDQSRSGGTLSTRLLFVEALVLCENGRGREALEAARAAARADAKNAELLVETGRTTNALGDREGAVAAYEEAVRLAPASPSVHLTLADLFREMGRYDDALTELHRASELGARDPDSTTLAGQLELLAAASRSLSSGGRNAAPAATTDDQLAFAEAANAQGLSALAATSYSLALDPSSPAPMDVPAETLRAAASSAVAAGSGGSEDSQVLSEEARHRWRVQAAGWLKRSLVKLRVAVEGDGVDDRAVALRELRRCKWDPALAAIRDPQRVEALGDVEKDDLHHVWADVDDLLRTGADRAASVGR
jgi:serine/threonine-protein kinase